MPVGESPLVDSGSEAKQVWPWSVWGQGTLKDYLCTARSGAGDSEGTFQPPIVHTASWHWGRLCWGRCNLLDGQWKGEM